MSACSASSCLVADSTLAIISVAGMYAGVTAKLSPFFSRAISALSRDLEINNPVSFVNIQHINW